MQKHWTEMLAAGPVEDAATFACDADRGVYVIEVRGHVVFEPRTLREVRAFCEMHNGRLLAR